MVLYETVLVRTTGQTVGKMLLGVRVARLTSGGRPDLSQSALRSLVPTSVVAIPLAALCYPFFYLSAWFSPLRRDIPDHAGGTVVVRTR
jgi:uncharacterized RDD family membrane protein YckC